MKQKEIDEIIRSIWMDLLGCKHLSSEGDFFELGGDSIMALNMLFEVGTTFEIELLPNALFDNPTFGPFAISVGKAIDNTRLG